MCEYWHTVRTVLTPSPDGVVISPVRAPRSTGEPATPLGILCASNGNPEPCPGSWFGGSLLLVDFAGLGCEWAGSGTADDPSDGSAPTGSTSGRHAAASTTSSAAAPTSTVFRARGDRMVLLRGYGVTCRPAARVRRRACANHTSRRSRRSRESRC